MGRSNGHATRRDRRSVSALIPFVRGGWERALTAPGGAKPGCGEDCPGASSKNLRVMRRLGSTNPAECRASLFNKQPENEVLAGYGGERTDSRRPSCLLRLGRCGWSPKNQITPARVFETTSSEDWAVSRAAAGRFRISSQPFTSKGYTIRRQQKAGTLVRLALPLGTRDAQRASYLYIFFAMRRAGNDV